ncbi:MAG: GNAT family N-acetyltransferase [Anaerolineae bacterium]|nr:GNAT family N-acetyltransferase [Anaerolineae bacterium]
MSDSPTVTLRGQRSDDWDNLFGLLNHDDVRYLIDDVPYLSDDEFRERYINAADNVHRLIGEIVLPSGRKRFVGWARVTLRQRRRRHVGVLQLLVHPDHYESDEEDEFLTQVLRFVDDWIGLHRLELVLYTDDARLIALVEPYGFVCEATMQRYALRDGDYHAACMMVRLRGPHRAQNTSQSTEIAPLPTESAAPLSEITVRGIEADDWEDTAVILHSGNVIANTLQLPYTSRDASRDRLENLPDTLRMLAAVVDGKVVGQLGIHMASGRRAHSVYLGMMVHADFQGRGVGTALMEAAVNLCERWLNITHMAL